MIGGQGSSPCGKLPFSLEICPCCGQGVKRSRGFTWINTGLFKDVTCKTFLEGAGRPQPCEFCPLSSPGEKIGLLWVGEKYYRDPGTFTREATRLGVSRRISQIPKGVKPGKTWIALAHSRAITRFGFFPVNPKKAELHGAGMPTGYGGTLLTPGYTVHPGIFMVFKLEKLEYVVTGNESPLQLDALQKRGLDLVRVIPNTNAQTSLL